MKMRRYLPLLVFGTAALGCSGPAAQDEVRLDLEVAGSRFVPVALDEGGELSLTRADLVFGPLTLCPGAQAGALCDTARLEWRDAAVVDVLSPASHGVGELVGATGGVRSLMYDLGYVSLLGEKGTRLTTTAARRLNASLALDGSARIKGTTIPFSARVVVQSYDDNEQGVPVVRRASSPAFNHEVTTGDRGLLVSFDAAPWVATLTVADFVQDETCSAAKQVVCSGQIELTCSAAGAEGNTRDCSNDGLVCAPDVGCADVVLFSDTTRAYRVLVQALTAGRSPEFDYF